MSLTVDSGLTSVNTAFDPRSLENQKVDRATTEARSDHSERASELGKCPTWWRGPDMRNSCNLGVVIEPHHHGVESGLRIGNG